MFIVNKNTIMEKITGNWLKQNPKENLHQRKKIIWESADNEDAKLEQVVEHPIKCTKHNYSS